MEQTIAVLASAILGTILLLIFAGVARSAQSSASAEDVANATGRWRRMTFWSLVLLFVPIIGFNSVMIG